MPLNVSLNKASANSYLIVFPTLPIPAAGHREFVLNISGTVIPGLSLDTRADDWMGGTAKFPGKKVEFSEWSCTFTVDEQFKNWRVIHDWITFINNNNDKFVEKGCCVDGSLMITDNYKKPIVVLSLFNVWPSSLGEVSLSHREGNSYLESSVNFVYDRFELSEHK
jgi:hypothetical protein